MDVEKYELNIDMNYTEKGKHEPEAKPQNRTITERIHVHYHNLFYKDIHKVMLI